MAHSAGQPLVVSLNCLDDPSLEQEGLAAVLLPSLAFLPRAAQRRLRPWQLLLCLGSPGRAADAAAAADLGLRLVPVDANRADEVADTVMALFLGLLRRTHLLLRHSSSAPAAVAAGSVQPLCRGMRRCRGLVLGIIGRSAAARCLATRRLAFRMSVLYFDPCYVPMWYWICDFLRFYSFICLLVLCCYLHSSRILDFNARIAGIGNINGLFP